MLAGTMAKAESCAYIGAWLPNYIRILFSWNT